MKTLKNWWRKKTPADKYAFVLDTCFYAIIVTLILGPLVLWTVW